MTAFGTVREAKEFLIDRIVAESQLEGVPLSETEEKMLYFSETGWTLPDIAQVNDDFDREYDSAKYERKIRRLVRNLRRSTRTDHPEEFDAWTRAVTRLRREDHYLLVMVDDVESPALSGKRLLKLTGIALTIVSAIMIIAFWIYNR